MLNELQKVMNDTRGFIEQIMNEWGGFILPKKN